MCGVFIWSLNITTCVRGREHSTSRNSGSGVGTIITAHAAEEVEGMGNDALALKNWQLLIHPVQAWTYHVTQLAHILFVYWDPLHRRVCLCLADLGNPRLTLWIIPFLHCSIRGRFGGLTAEADLWIAATERATVARRPRQTWKQVGGPEWMEPQKKITGLDLLGSGSYQFLRCKDLRSKLRTLRVLRT